MFSTRKAALRRRLLQCAVVFSAVSLSTSCVVSGTATPVAPTVTVNSDDPRHPGLSIVLPDSLGADFTRLQSALPGQVGMALMPVGGGRMTIYGDWTSGIAWSTIKVPLAVAALRHEQNQSIFEMVRAAITVSDNDAAYGLWTSLGDGPAAAEAVQRVLDEAGGTTTGTAVRHPEMNATSFGSTEWSLADQVRFASRLPCLPHTEVVTALMGEIDPDQGWGLGLLDGTEFKGGWGPDDDTGVYTVRQFGLVPVGSGQLAVALAAQADSGAFEDTTALLDRMAVLLDRHLPELRGGVCPR
ncbi:hypothetical protein BOX37_22295 [Nocardia mangyaensis]|uniref:Serine hydrolase n=1 Tax=Nocardia mangyaensis TaxID=2213200 RepID=A0A1J0VW25_9NOCA|nr:hypothetical protein [Nocardia mangyaensis]APE36202.1 hypothetical protein BOX37_22295 [Nocardia mangyaensis]